MNIKKKWTIVTLLAARATAEITTSFWYPNNFLGTDKITFVADVLGAENGRMTLAAQPSDDPDYTALGLVTDPAETLTLASTLFEVSTSQLYNHGEAAPGDYAYSLRCEIQAVYDAPATCTVSHGPGYLRNQCATRTMEIPGRTVSYDWTFSNPGTQGVETILKTIPGASITPLPNWCSAIDEDGNGPVPSSEMIRTYKVPRSQLTMYTYIITAGEENLKATTGAQATTSTAQVTRQSGSSSPGPYESGATPTASSGDGAPIKTVVPALAGLGVAMAAFL